MKIPFLPHNPWRACAWKTAIQIQRRAPTKEIKYLVFVPTNLQNMKLLHYWLQVKEMEATEQGQHIQDIKLVKASWKV